MTHIEQMEKWVNGESVHNDDANVEGGECCPDFSCCAPGLLWAKETRERFAKAIYEEDEETKSEMLNESLSALLDYNEIRKTHIIA